MGRVFIKKLENGVEYYNEKGELHRDFDRPAIEWDDGRKQWWFNGKLHRLDGPASINVGGYIEGYEEWWVNGKRHREGGLPAVEWNNGSKEWYNNDKLHRVDGPAIDDSDGGKEWWIDGLRHREDGPAIEWFNGSKEWLIDGKLHRLDGPAKEFANGDKQWWIKGKSFQTKKDYDQGLIEYREQEGLFAPKGEKEEEFIFETEYGLEWRNSNGERHREDGPACEYAIGTKAWYINGIKHRLDGPAIENCDGSRHWYVNGKDYTEKEFNKYIKDNG